AISGADDAARLGAALAAIQRAFGSLSSALANIDAAALAYQSNAEANLLESFGTYRDIVRGVNSTLTACPPSGAIAGIYALVDGQRGVWKAPANVSLTGVIGPTYALDSDDTDNLNVDATAGKSVNAIRAFVGKGTLVWGARTLAGNDNEWRYISVRRFFNMVEESVKKSTYWAVFEPNDANTWVKVRGMIESYLTQKWREGALAGSTTKDAFFVRCGLGTTMSSQDILEGRMYVEIGMAVVRPAEFIILKFYHKLQTS
ncbi:phage tail sheath C-terminal domain-containing protein, partial [Zoogloea sp.]|uniref:phage tail sheath family protein n=1 Tax=Zoogloea sp. TaxID=49181 RepID=UPI00258377CD